MANKDDEIEEILKQIKQSGEPRGESREPGKAEEHSGGRPLEPALNELRGRESRVNNGGNEYEEEEVDYVKKPAAKKIAVIALAVIVVIAAVCAVYFGVIRGREKETTTAPTTTTTTQAPVIITNPLTGEADYSESAVGMRPLAVVVENSPQARPQYNMDTPDMIIEGEVEGGITRMLWMYADMTALPEQVGPTRSARPSFVQFSQFFDSIFVHYGESHSKGAYVGADDVIKNENIDNINGMNVSSCFRRTSDKSSPHNAVLVGDKIVEAIEKKDYRLETDNSKFTSLSFNEKSTAVSATPCSSITVKFSSSTGSHTFTYDSTDAAYKNQSDFKQEVSFTNIITLFADSEYIDKENYKGSGKTETYCNYDFTSGTGKLASAGTVTDFTWTVKNGVLEFTAADGKELKLNPGRSWIGLVSANHSGSAEVK